jgi:hypothetical protein
MKSAAMTYRRLIPALLSGWRSSHTKLKAWRIRSRPDPHVGVPHSRPSLSIKLRPQFPSVLSQKYVLSYPSTACTASSPRSRTSLSMDRDRSVCDGVVAPSLALQLRFGGDHLLLWHWDPQHRCLISFCWVFSGYAFGERKGGHHATESAILLRPYPAQSPFHYGNG